MSFLQLVRRETQASLRKLVFMSSLSGISNATILAAINQGAHFADESKKASVWAASLFVISLFLFIKTQAYVTTTITAEIEAIIQAAEQCHHAGGDEKISIGRFERHHDNRRG